MLDPGKKEDQLDSMSRPLAMSLTLPAFLMMSTMEHGVGRSVCNIYC